MEERNLYIPQALLILQRELDAVNWETAFVKLEAFIQLVKKWNVPLGLVSDKDLVEIEKAHVVDSLSLARWVAKYGQEGEGYMDIGSGAGFPAIPLKIALSQLSVTLVERSPKRAGFLRKAVASLGLESVRIVSGEFPSAVKQMAPGLITARAVENPAKLAKNLVPFLERGAVFLCQTPHPERLFPDMFHVEHVVDEWTELGLRRGSLAIIRKRHPSQ